MAKKSSSRKYLKSLFSKGEGRHDESVEKNVYKDEGEKKKIKFLRFKAKSKNGSATETTQVLSAAEANSVVIDEEALADISTSDTKRLSLYSTAPRSKSKEFSYSELDLRKTKKFSTFSFGLKKKKKKEKDEENISKSTFGLDSTDVEVQDKTPLDLNQMKFSMSQPELDTSDSFNIPSPPPVATNQPESSVTLLWQLQSFFPVSTQPETKGLLTNGSDHSDVHEEPPKAPIASIPELQLDDDELNISVHYNSSKTEVGSSAPVTQTETTSAVDTQAAPSPPASHPQIVSDSSALKAAVVDSFYSSNGLHDKDILQQSNTKMKLSLTESNSVSLSHHQSDVPSPRADSTTPSGKPTLISVHPKLDATITEAAPALHSDNSSNTDSSTIHQEFSVSGNKRSISETDESVSTASTFTSKKGAAPVSPEVYGVLYESLFPQSFTSEVMSSLSNPPPQIQTKIRQLNAKSEPVVKTLSKCDTETVICSHMTTSCDFMDDAECSYTNINASFSDKKVVSSSDCSRFTSYQSSEPQTDRDIHRRYLPSSLSSASEPVYQDIPYSELTCAHSGVKSERFNLIQETIGSVPVVQKSAPPLSDYVASKGTDTPVTAGKRKVILVKELVTDEARADPGCPVADKMSTVKGLEINIKATESFSPRSGQMDAYDGFLSPTYLSVGSNDSSTTEIYFSAEEDNAEELEEEDMNTMDKKEGICMVEVQQPENKGNFIGGINGRDERNLKVLIVKIHSEESKMDNEERTEDLNSQTEAQQHFGGQKAEVQEHKTGMSEFLVSSDEESRGEEMYTVDETEEKCMVDGLKEVQQPEEQGETVERGISKRNEGDLGMLSVKMQNGGSKMGTEEKTEDLNNRPQMQQQLEGQRTEVQEHKTGTSEVLVSSEEESKDENTYIIDERPEICMVEGLKEELQPEEQRKIVEGGISNRDEGDLGMVSVKKQNGGSKMDNEEKTEALNSRPQMQQLEGQRTEVQEHKTGTPEVLVSSEEESKDENTYIIDERPEICMVEGLKEELQPEEQRKIVEGGISNRDEGDLGMVSVKKQNGGSKMDNEEKTEALNSRPQMQQLEGQRTEVQEHKTGTSEVLVSSEEESKDEKTYIIDERPEICMVAGLKEELQPEEQRKIVEGGISNRDEGDLGMVSVKKHNGGSKMDNEEKTEALNSRPQMQQLEGQRTEVQEHKTGTSEFLVSSDAKSQQKEEGATALPQMKKEEEEGRKEELLATPVQQVHKPSRKPCGKVERPEGKQTEDLETEDHLNGEKQLPSQDLQSLAYKGIKSSEFIHASSNNTREEDVRNEEEQVSATADESRETSEESTETTTNAVTDSCAGAEVVMGTLTPSAELQSDATEIEDKRATQRSEWVDTVTQSIDSNKTAREQVTVELSVSDADTHHPDSEVAEVLPQKHKHLPEAQPDVNQGSLAPSRNPPAASESQQTKASQELVYKMNSGYSSLSTKLSKRNLSPVKEEDSKHRIHKVSLISTTDTTSISQDTVDFSKTSTTVTASNGTDFDPENKWKNRFYGVSQYKPEDTSFSDSPSYSKSDTYSSTTSSYAFPEATAYKYQSDMFFSSSPFPENHITLGNRLNDRTEVSLSHERDPVGEPKDEWRRGLVEQEESVAPAGEREGETESQRIKSRLDSQQLPESSFSSAVQSSHIDGFTEDDDDNEASRFTGVFKATFVELDSDPPAPPSTPPESPDADSSSQFEMENLVDTLKSMGPPMRPRSMGPRLPPLLLNSLPPIVEDAPSFVSSDIIAPTTSATKKTEATSTPADSLNGFYTLPADLGLKRSSPRDIRSPTEMMKQNLQDQQQQSGAKGPNLPLRASAINSIVMGTSADSSTEHPVLNGNGVLPSSSTGSRLDNSVIFRSYRSSSIDLTPENGKTHHSLFRTSSLPDVQPSKDHISGGMKELNELSTGTDPAGSRLERISLLVNSSSSSSSSLTGAEDLNTRMSRPPPFNISTPPTSSSSTRLLSPTGSIDLHRSFTTTDSSPSIFGQAQGTGLGTGVLGKSMLQRSFSSEGTAGVQQTSLFNNVPGGAQFQSQKTEPDRSLALKYRAFPDAYLTKEKKHGKLNPRPGKMYIFDRPGMCGQRIEVRSDIIDATPWELQETISIRVIRGGWVLYEKPNFKGEKIALDEGDIELTYPFNPPEGQLQNRQEDGDEQTESKPAGRFIIGSLRRTVRDYSVPEICLFPEENAEGKKVIFRDTSEDARIFGFPVKAKSIIVNAGLWLVFAQPFFQGVPRILEVGGYSNPAAWGVEQPYVGSVHPLKIGEPRVENMSEPKMVIYEKAYFTGKSRTITTNMRDFMTRTDRQHPVFMYSVGSLKVQGGIWVGYEKEAFRGHQYLLEEGEYHDWRVWGGCDAELRSVRVIRADLTDPLIVMFEQTEEQEGIAEDNPFEVTEAIPDVEAFGYKTSTRSIQVVSGAWVAYSHVDFSGKQYILEKGFYNNCADWGSLDDRICSVQPILLAPGDSSRTRNEILLYSEPDFQGECHVFDNNQEALSEKLLTNSCRVARGSWALYESKQYSGNVYVLSEGDYPNLTSMGCLPGSTVRSVKVVPMLFSVPSISLFGLECLEGREITIETEILNMVEEGFNNHILSVRVNSGCWVICEHSNYRGRQFLLEPIEITNWPKFSALHTIGSIYPIKQRRHFFRIKNKDRGHFMSVQGGVEEMKSGRVVVTPEGEPMNDIWFYQDGLIKNKLSQTLSLQVMGNIEPAAKVVLWTETRQPIQTWAAQMTGLITSLTFTGMVLDVKGGKTYDKDHVVIMPENKERPSQQWEIELL